MPQHRYARSSAAPAAPAHRDRWLHHGRNEVTEIIPLDGFDELDELELAELDDLDFGTGLDEHIHTHLLLAPELDDSHAADNLSPLRLDGPHDVLLRVTVEADPVTDRSPSMDVIGVPRRGVQHRRQPTSAAKG
ncbi:MAG: M23 family peptidase, partial [Mycobacterium sp.]